MSQHRITASWDALSVQAMYTTQMFFNKALRLLEDSGHGYTTADAVALAGHMATDFRTSAMGVHSQNLTQSIDDFTAAITEAIYNAQ